MPIQGQQVSVYSPSLRHPAFPTMRSTTTTAKVTIKAVLQSLVFFICSLKISVAKGIFCFFIIFTIPLLRRIWYDSLYPALLCVRVTCPFQRLRLCEGVFIFSGLHTLPFYGSPYMANVIVYGLYGCQIAN